MPGRTAPELGIGVIGDQACRFRGCLHVLQERGEGFWGGCEIAEIFKRKPAILRNGAEHYARALEREAQNLAAYAKSAYDRCSQDLRMWITGGVGLVAGMFLILLLLRILPFAADPAKARNIARSSHFYETNAGGIGTCFEAARQTGKGQKCTITVPAPE